jgi:aquaporin Z
MIQEVTVEFLGTSLLLSAIKFIGTPIAIAGALFLAIFVGGSISGGHFNPAVTTWAYLSGKVGVNKAILYILAQLSAASAVWLLA